MPTDPRPPYDDSLLSLHLAQAAAAFPGPDYYAVLRWIHQILAPRTYLEIGVRAGQSLRAAGDETLCIGIDPEPAIQGPLPARARIFAMTSDAFFAQHDPRTILSAEAVDLAFIDGSHLWEQALKDFINLERAAASSSVILLHDCLPLDAVTSRRERSTHFYTGDVWKLAACLKKQRPDLRMATIRTHPTGLTLVTGLDRHSTVLSSGFDRWVSEFGALEYEDFARHPERMPGQLENSFNPVKSWLRPQGLSLPAA